LLIKDDVLPDPSRANVRYSLKEKGLTALGLISPLRVSVTVEPELDRLVVASVMASEQLLGTNLSGWALPTNFGTTRLWRRETALMIIPIGNNRTSRRNGCGVCLRELEGLGIARIHYN